ncbi:ATP-grasp domain-containing protein [Actinoallomurus sp. CA-150999]|uniref:ATP-grasp domain-containing protein n=1 Tax=Actinoallomurus sp. CA-150999 TaxID=3239887 RepID=UPI003D9451B0
MPNLVVVYDEGSASPMEIRTGLARLGDVTFVLPPSAHNDRLAPLLRELGDVVPVPDAEPAAIDEVARLKPDAVLTFSERRVRLTAALTERFGLPGHRKTTAVLLTDKSLQRERLRGTGVDPIRSATLTGPEDWPRGVRDVGLPAVLKPLIGEGSRSTYLIEDEADGLRTMRELPGPMVLEQYLRGRDSGPFGDYVSVESVTSHGRVSHVAVTGKYPLLPPFRETGAFWPSSLSSAECAALCELAGKALEALGIDSGVTHTEIKLTGDGPHIIEVNGRVGGHLTELYLRAMGLDLVELAGRTALGEDVGRHPAPATNDVFFQYFNPAPRQAAKLAAAHGAAEVRRLPGIAAYRRLIQPGEMVTDTVMTQRLDIISGSAPDHQIMFKILDDACTALSFTFETASGTARIRASELRDHGDDIRTTSGH